MRILIFGSANIDFVYAVDNIVRPGETTQSEEINVFPGGKGLNQAVAIARGGAPCSFAGTIGADGLFLRELLRTAGVDTTLLKVSENKTGHAIIQVDRCGHNSIIIANGANYENGREYVDQVLSHYAAGDYLILQNEINDPAYLIRRAYSRGMVIFLNPSPVNEALLSLDLSHVSYLILNETEAEQIGGTGQTEEFLQKIRRAYPHLRVVLTLGANGSIYDDEGGRYHCRAYRVRAVDTTAAGDTFTGYFAAMLSLGHPVKEALRYASAAAAVAVSRPGAAVSIPRFAEVREAMGTMLRSDRSSEILRQLYLYLETHMTDATLSGFAELVGYCPDYAGRQVRELTGKCFVALLQESRCSEAARQLGETDLPVGQISAAVGYANESHFRRIFRQQYGKAPLTYRKEMRENRTEIV